MIISSVLHSAIFPTISVQGQFFSDGQSFDLPSFNPAFDFQPMLKNDPKNPPYTNRGGITINRCKITGLYPIPPMQKISALIDYLSFTFPYPELHAILNLGNKYADQQKAPDAIQDFMLFVLPKYIPDLTIHDRHTGLFGYEFSFSLYRDGQHAGLLAYGGNGDGVYLSLSGVGCSGVDMYGFRCFLEQIKHLKLTRVDCAHDDLDGRYSMGFWVRAYKYNKFSNGAARSTSIYYDDMGSNKGKTLTVGKKTNGKEACIYEKGKQLGDNSSPWVRVEGRLTSADGRVIPLDILTSPSAFLCAMYPCFAYLCDYHEAVKSVKLKVKISVEKMLHHMSQSYGMFTQTLSDIGWSPEEILNKTNRKGVPKRLLIPAVAEQAISQSFEEWMGGVIEFDQFGLPVSF